MGLENWLSRSLSLRLPFRVFIAGCVTCFQVRQRRFRFLCNLVGWIYYKYIWAKYDDDMNSFMCLFECQNTNKSKFIKKKESMFGLNKPPFVSQW